MGLPEEEAVDLVGGLSAQGVVELLGADLSLAVRGGRLTPTGRAALRNAHLDELADRQQAIDVKTLADSLDLDFRGVDEEPPGFDSREIYRVPRSATPATIRAWMAHGVAHVLIWTGQPAPLECSASSRVGAATPSGRTEREASRLAHKLLVPSATLQAAARRIRARRLCDARRAGGHDHAARQPAERPRRAAHSTARRREHHRRRPMTEPFDPDMESPISAVLAVRNDGQDSVVAIGGPNDSQARAYRRGRLDRALTELARRQPPPHVIVATGSAGGGKSAAVEEQAKANPYLYSDIIQDATHSDSPLDNQAETLLHPAGPACGRQRTPR